MREWRQGRNCLNREIGATVYCCPVEKRDTVYCYWVSRTMTSFRSV